ncbi:efflux transporter outer membrane subunit [Alcaligenes sp. WGS1538]|uniref:efflux transporter outer membrane subunit n=1 Tax=Alcaligenes sp. WGS1538 TaxID=3366811 RepID=UPI00372D4B8F
MPANRLFFAPLTRLSLALLLGGLAGCAVGPDYQRPDAPVGEHFREARVEGAWKTAQPADLQARGAWWAAFNDGVLDELMRGLNTQNFSVQQAEARVRQAQAALSSARSGLFPQVNGTAASTRRGSGSGQTSQSGSTYDLNANVSWEVDLWGRIRRQVESGDASLQASAADMAATRLSLQSQLAQTYFQYRSAESAERLLDQTVQAYERSLQINQNRLDAGFSAQSDVAAALSQLEGARTQRLALNREKAGYQHALAVLVGRPPSQFELVPHAPWPVVPDIPVGLPSSLLERRPDVARAERRMAQANAEIGVAKAAWFPSLKLNASGGFSSSDLSEWLTAPARVWSLGPSLALTLLDFGARRAKVEQAEAGYDEQVAAYRQTVLTALKEVEDALSDLNGLGLEQASQARALAAARESLQLTRNQFDAGLVDYLSLAQTETTAFSAERQALDLESQRLRAAVKLLVALGGGWAAPSGSEQAEPGTTASAGSP